jgi:ABC-type uncharacterized transport system substrate-binding protein
MANTANETSFFTDVCKNFDSAAQFTSHPEGLLAQIKHVTVYIVFNSQFAEVMALK